MMITSIFTMDLQQPDKPAVVNAVQEDRYTRQLQITLTSAGADWPVPGNAGVLVCYTRPDGTGGRYDILPDGAAAWSASGNVLTVILAPQVLAVPGPVSLWITLTQAQTQLSTFSVLVNVAPRADPADGAEHTDVSALILTDRETNARFRFFVSGGDLMMEEVN